MDDIVRQVPSYQLDQEILDARGINMTVEEVAGLPTCKYSERVQALNLSEDDLAFLRGLRRRIKNRVLSAYPAMCRIQCEAKRRIFLFHTHKAFQELASQNSRRRSMEHLRRLTRELRAVRACRDDALSERRALLQSRTEVRNRFYLLRNYVLQTLKDRSDPTEVPDIDPDVPQLNLQPKNIKLPLDFKEKEKTKFECRIEKLVQQSVDHIFKDKNETRICAKTVFLDTIRCDRSELEMDGVLNLCIKEKKRSHGRKQLAPRRIACCDDGTDGVLDLKIKKENQ